MKTGYANGILIRLALSSINDGHKIFDINHAAGHHLPFDYNAQKICENNTHCQQKRDNYYQYLHYGMHN